MNTLKRTTLLSTLCVVLSAGFLAGNASAQDNSGSGQSGSYSQSGSGDNNGRAQTMRDNDGMDLGWLGLVGLAGLLGLRKRTEHHDRYVATGPGSGTTTGVR